MMKKFHRSVIECYLLRLKKLCALAADKYAPYISSLGDMIFFATGVKAEGFLIIRPGLPAELITDPRFTGDAFSHLSPHLKVIITDNPVGALQNALITEKRVQMNFSEISFSDYQIICEEGSGRQAEDCSVEVDTVLAQWDRVFERNYKQALSISEQVYTFAEKKLKPGMSETELAHFIKLKLLQLGGEAEAFPTIVAFGSNSAIPHHSPGETVYRKGMVALLDFGVALGDVRTDITRMLKKETVTDTKFQAVYGFLKKQLTLLPGFAALSSQPEILDRVFRQNVVNFFGNADAVKHSLGHGVGYKIHLPPRLSIRTTSQFSQGAVFTIEPGLYFPGEFGIRLENNYLITDTGCRNLTKQLPL